MTSASARLFPLVLIGILTGVFSGLFGVGGGIIMVPALAAFTTLGRREISGTSLAAIVPMAITGVISYGASGNLNLLAAALLAAGSVVGAQIGTWLLPRVPTALIRWLFIAFLILVAVQLVTSIPTRDQDVHITVLGGAGLVLLGLITGIMSGLLGIGGGIIVVSALMLLFGFSDLAAKGTSLAMMIPTALSGTIGNVRHRNVHLPAGLTLGITASATTIFGTWIAGALAPTVANWLLAAFLVCILVQQLTPEIRRLRRGTERE